MGNCVKSKHDVKHEESNKVEVEQEYFPLFMLK